MSKPQADGIEMIFIVDNVGFSNNGVTESVLRKVKLIEDKWGYEPIILSAFQNTHMGLVNNTFKDGSRSDSQTKVNSGTRMFSVYNYFQNNYPFVTFENSRQYTMQSNADYRYERIEGEEGYTFDVYDGDRLIKRESFTDQKRLNSEVFYNEDGGKAVTRYYDFLGYEAQEVIWDAKNQDFHPFVNYRSADNSVHIQGQYRYIESPEKSPHLYNSVQKYHSELIRYVLYNGQGNAIGAIESHEQLLAACLDGLTNDPNKTYVICDECGFFPGSATMLKKSNIINTMVMHSAFLSNPYNLKSKPQPFFVYLSANWDKYDGIVILTESEANDFVEVHGLAAKKRLFTIGHPYSFPIVRADMDKRDFKKAIVVSRFDPVKRITLMVGIFAEVLKEVPDAVFEMYGRGKDEEAVQEKIDELDVGDSVKMMGYTSNAAQVMSEAACFMMTSVCEGMPLTLLESLSNGCPVFAYDIKYGPSEMVIDGKTGFLFKDGDSESFAKAMAEYFKNPVKQREMVENCYDDAPRFDVDTFLAKWGDMLTKLYNRKSRRGI
jgi:poly(glycerol-phosphate) alpha-glucosyltransferase